MSKDVKVLSINVEIGKRSIQLTVEEAKKLKEILEDIFGKKTIVEREIYRYWIKPQPTIYRPYEIICKTLSNDTLSG